VAHKVSDLGTLEFLFFGLAFAVAHEEEQTDADAGDCDDTYNNTSGNTSHICAGASIGLVCAGCIGRLGLLLA